VAYWPTGDSFLPPHLNQDRLTVQLIRYSLEDESMTTQLAQDQHHAAPSLPESPSLPTREEALRNIVADSLRAPQTYLDEVVVPYGGE